MGRIVFTMLALPLSHDLYTFGLGCYILWGIITAGMCVAPRHACMHTRTHAHTHTHTHTHTLPHPVANANENFPPLDLSHELASHSRMVINQCETFA